MTGARTSLLVLLLAGSACARGADQDLGAERRSFPAARPLEASSVRLDGELGARYSAAMVNVLTHTDRYSLDSFAASAAGRPGALWWDWPGDQIGRWLSVVHVAEGYGWTPAADSRAAVADVVLPLQTGGGNFGPPGSKTSDDVRLTSGNAFALRGLMDAYSDTRDPRWLDAARRLARYFETSAPRWETSRDGHLHEFFGHCIDGLVALYKQGGDRWALDLAERLARQVGRTPHTHHTLSLCRGLIDLARVTGRRDYLDPVEDYLVWCRERLGVSGSLPEAMPESPQDEGCGLADWIVVNLMMHAATGEQRYVDAAEHTLVNHFFLNQFHTGGFGHLTLASEVVGGRLWQGWEGRFGSENPGCCSLWGAWALGQVGRYIVTRSPGTVSVNLYAPARITLPESEVRLEMTGDFPRLKRVRIRVVAPGPERFTLALRVPPWAEGMRVTCDGTEVAGPGPGEPFRIERTWRGVTTVDLEIVSGLHLVGVPGSASPGIALFDGPLCLGLAGPAEDLAAEWAVLLDEAGRVRLDGQGRPLVIEPSGGTVRALEPIDAGWLEPDVNDPVPRRIVFRPGRRP